MNNIYLEPEPIVSTETTVPTVEHNNIDNVSKNINKSFCQKNTIYNNNITKFIQKRDFHILFNRAANRLNKNNPLITASDPDTFKTNNAGIRSSVLLNLPNSIYLQHISKSFNKTANYSTINNDKNNNIFYLYNDTTYKKEKEHDEFYLMIDNSELSRNMRKTDLYKLYNFSLLNSKIDVIKNLTETLEECYDNNEFVEFRFYFLNDD
jgi:hypothetical protein